jgi:gliding motility-associated-like protein
MNLFIKVLRNKNFIYIIFSLLCSNNVYSQCTACGPNLVPNPDFEITTAQCKQKDNQLYTNQTPVQDWYGTACTTCASNGITPDNFNSGCGGNATNNCGSGVGSVGVFTSTGKGDAREYVQAKLTAPLKAGRQYCVTVKIKSSGGSFIPTDGAGIWFNSIGMIDIDAMNGGNSFLGPGSKINATPQIQNAAGNIIGTTCQTISGKFCAAGGEQWIVMGNFKRDADLQPFSTCDCTVGGACGTKCTNCFGGTCAACPCRGSAYVIFDEVSVQESCATNLTVKANASPAVIQCGDCTDVSATVTGGSGTTKFTWTPNIGNGPGPYKVCPVKNTTYTVIATSTGNCGPLADTATVDVNVTCGPTVIVTNTNICEGGCNGIKATASGGTPPYVFSWSPSTGLNTTSGDSVYACPLVSTTYTVKVTDKNGAGLSATASSLVTVNPKPIISVTDATICMGSSTTLTASGATTYTWAPLTGLSSGTGSTVTANPATTTTYTVTGTTANGCSAEKTVVVTVNPIPTINVSNASICPGSSVVLTATGASTYNWSPNTGLNTTTENAVIANPASTTTYTITGTSSGCSGSATATVTVGAIIADAGINKTICPGDSTQLSASGGTVYKWSPATGLSNDTIFNPIAGPTVTTTYTVTVSSGNCTSQDIVIITVNPKTNLMLTPADILCFGQCNGKIVASVSGGTSPYSYLWSSGCSLPVCDGLCSGTYHLIVKDALGCTASDTAIIKEPAPLKVVTTQQKNASCFGTCDGAATVTASGGVAPYTYSWKASGQTTSSATALCAGTYTCTVTDAHNCSAMTVVTITVPSAIKLTANDVKICPNTTSPLTVSASGGKGQIHFTWSPASSLSSSTGTTVIASPVTTTTYTITGTDTNGCTGITTVVVTVQPPTVIDVQPATICQGSSVILSAEGADVNTYNWIPLTGLNTGTGSPVTANPVSTITYTVTGMKNGCKSTTTVVVTVTPVPVLTSLPAAICPGEDTVLTVSGATSYVWIPKQTLNTDTGNKIIASPKITTTYTITGTSANGCKGTTTVIVTVYPKPVALFTITPYSTDVFTPVIYFNDLSHGGIINKWKWNFGDPNHSTSTIQHPSFTYSDSANTYAVQLIVENQFGCIDTAVSTVKINDIFTFYIPNTFTPNDDPLNNLFLPKGVGIDETEYNLWIFDRWGNLIWHTTTWGEGWDGTANGGSMTAQIDTYIWKIHVKEKGSNLRHDYIGRVNIVK